MNSSMKGIDKSVAIIKAIDCYVALCSICSLEAKCHNAFDVIHSELTIVDLFCYCTKIKITENDNPYYVCLSCTAKLLNAYEFIKLCQESWSMYKLATNREQSPKIIGIESSNKKKYKKLIEENQVGTDNCKEESNRNYNEIAEQTNKKDPEDVETIEIIVNKIPMVNEEPTIQESCEIIEVKIGSSVKEVISGKNTADVTGIIEQIIPYFCEKCGKYFMRLKSLEKHILGHDNNQYQSKLCQKVSDFSKKYNLIKQTMTHNDKGELTKHLQERKSNENCTNGYSHLASERMEFGTNVKSLAQDKRRLLCHLCSKRFKCRENLKLHLYVHMGVKPHICEMCGKRFTQSQQLTAHLRTHSGEKPYACEYCAKCFTTSGTLVSHIRAQHTNTRPHVCSVCGKGFVQKPQLTSHLKVHKDVMSNDNSEKQHDSVGTFTCKLCLETFISKSYLIVHKCSKSYLAPYICETCGKGFNQKTQFLNHTRLHTGERPYVCQVCSEGFRSRSILKVHARKHSGEKPYVCEVCGKRFSQQQQLTSHTRVHSGEKPFECDICFKSFSMRGTLTVHRRTHTGETPYVCDGCNAGFYASSALKRHKLKCSVLVS